MKMYGIELIEQYGFSIADLGKNCKYIYRRAKFDCKNLLEYHGVQLTGNGELANGWLEYSYKVLEVFYELNEIKKLFIKYIGTEAIDVGTLYYLKIFLLEDYNDYDKQEFGTRSLDYLTYKNINFSISNGKLFHDNEPVELGRIFVKFDHLEEKKRHNLNYQEDEGVIRVYGAYPGSTQTTFYFFIDGNEVHRGYRGNIIKNEPCRFMKSASKLLN